LRFARLTVDFAVFFAFSADSEVDSELALRASDVFASLLVWDEDVTCAQVFDSEIGYVIVLATDFAIAADRNVLPAFMPWSLLPPPGEIVFSISKRKKVMLGLSVSIKLAS